MQISKRPLNLIPLLFNAKRYLQSNEPLYNYTTTISMETIDLFTSELLHRRKTKLQNINYNFGVNDLGIRCFMKSKPEEIIDIRKLTAEELCNTLADFQTKNNDEHVKKMILECQEVKRHINEHVLKQLLRTYCLVGKVDMVKVIQSYCEKTLPSVYVKNGEFLHYLAKAQCMKGNSDKGLLILQDCYSRYAPLRSLYRLIFKELILDSVLNRSEASMVIFKKNVLEFSERWGDHYPLVCLWHICWISNWFSDQMLSNELLDASQVLRNIVKDKSTAFSITALRRENNEDAVFRLLQSLLKYNLMSEYVKVLQVLFSYKVKNRDLRGCTEIMRHCEVLGISLPADQQGKYIHMLIAGKPALVTEAKPTTKNLKFNF